MAVRLFRPRLGRQDIRQQRRCRSDDPAHAGARPADVGARLPVEKSTRHGGPRRCRLQAPRRSGHRRWCVLRRKHAELDSDRIESSTSWSPMWRGYSRRSGAASIRRGRRSPTTSPRRWCSTATASLPVGLGCYRPPLVTAPIPKPPPDPKLGLYDGKQRIGNLGKTKITWMPNSDVHPARLRPSRGPRPDPERTWRGCCTRR